MTEGRITKLSMGNKSVEYLLNTMIYQKISNISKKLAAVGISKERRNVQQGFTFRGIDDVYKALSPLLTKEGVVITPSVLGQEYSEHTTKSGGVSFRTRLTVQYNFFCTEDGSNCACVVVGEGMDSGDKSVAKAMSAAYKYACFQVFCIPVEGSPDADSDTPELMVSTHIEKESAASSNDQFVEEIPSPLADWRHFMVKYGKGLVGKLLGDVTTHELKALIDNWQPRKTVCGYRLDAANQRAALNAAQLEIRSLESREDDELP